MAFIAQEIPAVVPQYDTTDGTVKQTTERWQIMTDTVTKIFTVDPSQPDVKTGWTPPGTITLPRVRVGFTAATAALVVWLLNNSP